MRSEMEEQSHSRHSQLHAFLWSWCDWLVVRPAGGLVAIIANLPGVVSPVANAFVRTIAAKLSPADHLRMQRRLKQLGSSLKLAMPALVVAAIFLAWCRPIAACLLTVSLWAFLI